jgi:L-threonine kinase
MSYLAKVSRPVPSFKAPLAATMDALLEAPSGGTSHAVRSRAPATCGELIQGAIDGRDFLVNCPIDLYARAAARPGTEAGLHLHRAEVYGKVAQAVEVVREISGIDLHHEIRVESSIPRGKGMASSTADLTAAIEALCRSCDVLLSDEQMARVLTAVEPSDCVHFPGIAHVNQLTGELLDSMPAPVGMRVLVVDCGGEIDTVKFDRERARAVYRRNPQAIGAALHLVKLGLRQGDDRAVATAATLSARLSQEILPKPQFDDLLACTRECGALGVNCAHSGTVLGVMYREADRLGDKLLECVRRHLGDSVSIQGDYRVIAGCRYAGH